MEDYIIYLFLALAIAIIVYILNFINSRRIENTDQHDSSNEEILDDHQRETPVATNSTTRNRTARARMRIAQAVHSQVNDSDSEGDEEFLDDVSIPKDKIGKKKQAKLQAKADKRAQREAGEREREEKKERDEEKAEIKRKKEKEEEEEEAKIEDEERKRRDEEIKKERDEYEKMRRQFQVEEEGFDESLQSEQDKDLLTNFINYIKATKVVILEDLASKFQLKTQVVINRINDLVKDGSLTGVIDDRGKFIFIGENELQSVAKFIRQRGRVSISDIAEASNSLINLIPDAITVDS